MPGEVGTPNPTIPKPAVEWKIDGDDNENRQVQVEYRQAKNLAPRQRPLTSRGPGWSCDLDYDSPIACPSGAAWEM